MPLAPPRGLPGLGRSPVPIQGLAPEEGLADADVELGLQTKDRTTEKHTNTSWALETTGPFFCRFRFAVFVAGSDAVFSPVPSPFFDRLRL